jgi:uncharacterized protein YcbK (DUF882 family)
VSARIGSRKLGALFVGALALLAVPALIVIDAAGAPLASAPRVPFVSLFARSPKALHVATRPLDPAFAALLPLGVTNVNTRQRAELRLYDSTGALDPSAIARLEELLADARDPEHVEHATIDRRVLKLLFKAAYDFGAREIELISGYRKPGKRREGLHGAGRAIDFRLPGVKAAELAAYLRRLPRAGVGIYTHPRTQYVHLDVRDTSYHWLDASPPRRRWRERSLGRIKPEHDRRYEPEMDLPESVRASRGQAGAPGLSRDKIVSM